MVQYAADGYAFMFLDYRGRYGGETNGYPLNPNTDFALFENKEWPEYYLTICDISSARAILASRFGVPLYAVGGSNGGRYAAVAAGVDKNFAGYIGISTADWGIKEQALAQGGSGDIIRFATSLEPSTRICRPFPRDQSGCSTMQPIQLFPLPMGRPSLQLRMSQRTSPYLMADMELTRMSTTCSWPAWRKFMAHQRE